MQVYVDMLATKGHGQKQKRPRSVFSIWRNAAFAYILKEGRSRAPDGGVQHDQRKVLLKTEL